MADEYITRYDAETAIAEIYSPYGEDGSGDAISREVAMSEIRQIPAADVRPVVHARWIDNGIPDSMLSGCSACGYTCGAYSMRFCPNCGAMMDGEE